MTYIGELRMLLSFVPHDRPEFWLPMALEIRESYGTVFAVYCVWLEWVWRGGDENMQRACAELREFVS